MLLGRRNGANRSATGNGFQPHSTTVRQQPDRPPVVDGTACARSCSATFLHFTSNLQRQTVVHNSASAGLLHISDTFRNMCTNVFIAQTLCWTSIAGLDNIVHSFCNVQ
jgi:hypothetical protein